MRRLNFSVSLKLRNRLASSCARPGPLNHELPRPPSPILTVSTGAKAVVLNQCCPGPLPLVMSRFPAKSATWLVPGVLRYLLVWVGYIGEPLMPVMMPFTDQPPRIALATLLLLANFWPAPKGRS